MQQSIGVAAQHVPSESGIHTAIAHLIQSVRVEASLRRGSIWALTTAAALKLTAVDYASIIRVGQGDIVHTLASTDGHPRSLNKLQQRCPEGPSLDAAYENQPRRVDDLIDERRWPSFSDEAAATTPIRSMLCVPLFTHHHCTTALNLYAVQPYALAEGELIGLAFVDAAEAVLEVGRREKRYRQAQTNRELIGQAKAILMERFAVDTVTAFALLAQLSKGRGQPVSVVARGLVGKRSKG
jgi:hypothetical protein